MSTTSIPSSSYSSNLHGIPSNTLPPTSPSIPPAASSNNKRNNTYTMSPPSFSFPTRYVSPQTPLFNQQPPQNVMQQMSSSMNTNNTLVSMNPNISSAPMMNTSMGIPTNSRPPPTAMRQPVVGAANNVAHQLINRNSTMGSTQKRRRVQSTPAPDPSIPPNSTIYINNLNDSIKIDELKENLKSMFKQFGDIKQTIAMKSFWRRGQAWVVFSNVNSATKALHGMQGFLYHGQNMRINYAHTKSDIIAKEEGTFAPRPSGPKKPRAIQEREKRHDAMIAAMQQQYVEQLQASQTSPSGGRTDATASTVTTGSPSTGGTKWGVATPDADKQSMLAALQAKAAEAVRDVSKMREMDTSNVGNFQNFNMFQLPPQHHVEYVAAPNKLLFVENLPEGVQEAAVDGVFRKYGGFLEVRVIPGRRISFVDFESERDATVAMNALQGYTMDGSILKITYAKR